MGNTRLNEHDHVSCIQSSENNDMPYIVEIFQMKWTLKLLRTISFTSIYYRDGFYSPRVCWGCELKQYTTTVFTWLFVGHLNVSENLSKIGILQTEPLNHLEINRHYCFIFVYVCVIYTIVHVPCGTLTHWASGLSLNGLRIPGLWRLDRTHWRRHSQKTQSTDFHCAGFLTFASVCALYWT